VGDRRVMPMRRRATRHPSLSEIPRVSLHQRLATPPRVLLATLLAVAFASVAVPLLALGSAAPAASAVGCPSLKMLVVTGSGEHSGFGHILGSVVSHVYERDTDHASAERIEYPAISVLSPEIVEYNWSVGLGISALTRRVNSFLGECHHTPLFLLGYSQGAQVVGDVYLHWLSAAAQSRVTGVVLFGDPEFWGGQNAPIDVGSYDPALNGISTTMYPSHPKHLWTKADDAKVRSYCTANDPVCNFTRENAVGCFFSCSHVQYAETLLIPFTTYTEHAARFILSRWLQTVPPPAPPPLAPGSGGGGAHEVPPGTWAETVGGPTHTWSGYTTGSGAPGPGLLAGQTVGISCRVQGLAVSDGNRWWYRIASSPWNNTYYASADAFYNNGETLGSLVGTPFVDSSVPVCGGAPPPPPSPPAGTYSETTGGVAHTWTNYLNAGGTEGPSIPAYATVQISCRITGFRVADGNTWWYRVASSPWSNAYYVSADAFYNNGATSGSLIGTPFVDNSVPGC
jgi:Cutinase